MESSTLPTDTDPTFLRDQLDALRARHRTFSDTFANVALDANADLDALARLRDELSASFASGERAADERDRELDTELAAIAEEVDALAQHIADRSQTLHDEFNGLSTAMQAFEHEVADHHRHEHERVAQTSAQAHDLQLAIEGHRSEVSSGAESASLALTTVNEQVVARHHGFEQRLTELHQHTEHTGTEAGSAAERLHAQGETVAEELRQHLGALGEMVAAATERLQRAAEEAAEHEIHALIEAAVREVKRLFDDLVARLGHSHRELADARRLIEPLIHELESLVPGLDDRAGRAHEQAEEIQRHREEEAHHGYD